MKNSSLVETIRYYYTLSEKIAHSIVFHHLSHPSVDIQWSGLIKFKENSDVQTKLTQVGSYSLDWMLPQSTVLYFDELSIFEYSKTELSFQSVGVQT